MTTPAVKQFLIDTPSLYYDVDTTNIDSVVLDDKFLGLSKGGITLSIKPTVRQMEFDGRLEREVKGMDRITKYDALCEGSIVEFNTKILGASLLQKGTSSSTKYDMWIPDESLDSANYKNLLIVGKVHGSDTPIMVVLKNTYNSEGFNFEGKDNDESACKFSFKASYEPNSNVVPVEIYIKKSV